jgi:Na+/H+ antiporter NhaD/arsenite permease-like protein
MESILRLLASPIFILGYFAIALEHPLKISKSAVALLTGAVLWTMVAFTHSGEHLSGELSVAGADVFSIIVFLLAAMSLVEVLVHYRFFDLIRGKLFALNLTDRKQFIVICLLSFFLSAVIDNLTTTIIMIQISRKFFREKNMLIACAGIVIAANAGGAFSPIGDVTTIMLWFSKKFGTLEILYKAFIPSVVLWVVSTGLLVRKITPEDDDNKNEVVSKLNTSEKYVIAAVFCSFALPLVVSLIGLPPYFGLLFGLGFVWLLIDTFKRVTPTDTHLSASIEEFIKKTDIASLQFFIGILLAVSALHALGVLEQIASLIYGQKPGMTALIGGNVLMGMISSILDNVPLTAIAIQMLQTTDTNIWILLALTVGTGGSLLVIGSAAGVVAMGMNKELTFGNYFKIAFVPALLGYIAAVAAWYIQSQVL